MGAYNGKTSYNRHDVVYKKGNHGRRFFYRKKEVSHNLPKNLTETAKKEYNK